MKKTLILVADDDPKIRKLLTVILRSGIMSFRKRPTAIKLSRL